MGFGDARTEWILRLCAIICLVLTVFLMGFDKETTQIFGVDKTASFRSLGALKVIMFVDSIAAAYNILQLAKCWISAHPKPPFQLQTHFHLPLFWLSFFIDQAGAYLTFAANTAGMEAAFVAVRGNQEFQWMKLCNRFHRYCYQAAGAFLCGYAAVLTMLLISFLSAFNLFRHYSPNHFLRLKPNNN
ncbi:CASP-like protein 2C1 isoform X1 [Cucurbita moschata]|uniref:CASP-like protein n=1 Tax=Cucurbita moschata TaxID=3662 RepID=A0A6J1ET65_CUCMO|nr:CASP-like protein 2C1 isoform X1 [Cucurbita moschata]